MSREDALALIVGRLRHTAASDGMWEDSRDALLTLGFTQAEIDNAADRYYDL